MRSLARVSLLLLALTPLGCASGLAPAPNPMPAPRIGLAPEYRIFYDALVDYGHWTLIEPYGYVFRPNVSYIGWDPYEYGFWVPNDAFGWVWISSEPFGWATYHYGRWMRDKYEGWVWIPGADWGPAWVDWQLAGGYAGWAPLAVNGPPADPEAYHYVPLRALGATDLSGQVVPTSKLPSTSGFQRVENLAEVGGVVINRGPEFQLVERVAGPLRRVGISEVGLQGAPVDQEASSAARPKPVAPQLEPVKRKAEESAREAKRISDARAPAPREVSIVRLLRGEKKPAPADSTQR